MAIVKVEELFSRVDSEKKKCKEIKKSNEWNFKRISGKEMQELRKFNRFAGSQTGVKRERSETCAQ